MDRLLTTIAYWIFSLFFFCKIHKYSGFLTFFWTYSLFFRHLKILTDYEKIEGVASLWCGTTFDNYYFMNFQFFFCKIYDYLGFLTFFGTFSFFFRHLKILTDFEKIEWVASLWCGTTFANYYLLNFQNFLHTP